MDNKCCENPDSNDCPDNCCPSKPPENLRTSHGKWRIAALICILAVTAGAAVYSIRSHESAKTTEVKAATPQTANLNYINKLDDAFLANHDLVMVVSPGSNQILDTTILTAVNDFANKIKATDGKDVAVFTLSGNASVTPDTAVLLAGWSPDNGMYGHIYTITGEINDTRLTSAYVAACPGSSLACCAVDGASCCAVN